MSKKRIWGIAILILIIGLGLGGMLLMRRPAPEPRTVYKVPSEEVLENIRKKQGVASAPPRAAKPGYKWVWHNDHWDEVQVSETAGGAQRKRPKGPPLNIDWSGNSPLSLDWTDPRTAESYRNYYGFYPPTEEDYFKPVQDNFGNWIKHYRNTTVVKKYGKRIGFRPTVDQLARYKQLQAKLELARNLSSNGEPTPLMQSIQQEIRDLVDSAQGEIPTLVPREGIYYGDKQTPEMRKIRLAEADRALYKRMGIEHLYEFYEVDPFK